MLIFQGVKYSKELEPTGLTLISSNLSVQIPKNVTPCIQKRSGHLNIQMMDLAV